MNKYIKLEDAIYGDCILIDEIKCDDCPFYDEERFVCRMVEWLENLPTIDITLCEECENFNPMTHGCKRSPSVEPWWEDDFCSYGERIEK